MDGRGPNSIAKNGLGLVCTTDNGGMVLWAVLLCQILRWTDYGYVRFFWDRKGQCSAPPKRLAQIDFIWTEKNHFFCNAARHQGPMPATCKCFGPPHAPPTLCIAHCGGKFHSEIPATSANFGATAEKSGGRFPQQGNTRDRCA